MTLIDRLRGRQPIVPMDRPLPNLDRADGGFVKAVYGDSYLTSLQSGPLISSLLNGSPQQRAARFLQVYKVGWFYKAERKISTDIGLLRRTVSQEVDGDNEAEVIQPDLRTPVERLDPIGQFLRLMERPNPQYTGRKLFEKTQIRIDMAGWAFWYLEGGAGGGLPTAIYGISPARLWPSTDKAGNLLGWVMDKDSQNPVPFDPGEILPFTTATSDDTEWYGQGVVEAIQSSVPLSDLMARHTSDVLSTGGRLAGMMWPKNRALNEDEFQDAVRAWRNVTSDPNAARRLLIMPEPMEYAQGASTPAEIGLPDLANLDRDTIMSAFPMWPELLGIPMPSGLNTSGEARKEIIRSYHTESLHPRVELLEDTIQVGLLSRYENYVGGSWDFDIEEPNLDDASSIIEKSAAFKALVSIGFDAKEAVTAVGLDGIKWNGLPQILDPEFQAQAQQAAATAAAQQQNGPVVQVAETPKRGLNDNVTEVVAKARAERRDEVTDPALDLGKTELTRFLNEQQARLVTRIKATLPQTKAARKESLSDDWWDAKAEDKALTDALRELYLKVGHGSLNVVANQIGRTVLPLDVKRVLADLLRYGGDRITAINENTHDAVKAQLAEGVRRGYSIPQITDGVPAENYPGVQKALLDNGVAAFDSYRAEMIARTETALSYNRAAISGYDGFGVKEVQAIDGDGDEQCAERDGRTYSIEDAYGIQDHPNGTLDWIPIIPQGKSYEPQPITVAPVFNLTIPPNQTVVKMPTQDITNVIDVSEIEVHTDPAIVNVTNEVTSPTVNVTNEVQTPSVTVKNDVQTPTVNVSSPNVTVRNDVKTPTVKVEAPIVNVESPTLKATPEINVTIPAELRITSMPDRVKTRKVTRNQRGVIETTTEVETDG